MAKTKNILFIMADQLRCDYLSCYGHPYLKTPNIDNLSKNYNNSTLRTDGKHVGLPKGQMGNSEVGHMNIGAGRIVHQDLAKINISIRNNTLAKNKTLINSLNFAKENNKPIHYIGLLSNGGVHSHISHLEE